jgi:hypothetical protein
MAIWQRVVMVTVVSIVMQLGLRAHGQQDPSSSRQTTTPAPPTPPATGSKKKPATDPDSTLGVRGTGTSHTVRVLLKDKPVAGARVTVKKDATGIVAATCKTSASGECKVDVGADTYIIAATLKSHSGSRALAVRDSTDTIEIQLTKTQPDAGSPTKP